MVKASIEKLPAYIHHYVRRVIGIDVILDDSPQPCSVNTEKPRIELPMTRESLGLFLGEELVDQAPVELLFSIAVGLAYHEAAHLLSGEKHVEPHLLDNIICDSNDFNFVPGAWKGSMPFTICLVNTTYLQATNLNNLPLGTRNDKLQALIHLAITYLRKLRIKVRGKDARSLEQGHPLSPYFERIKPIMREARKAPVEDRPKLVKELYEILKDFWEDSKPQHGPNGQSLDDALNGMRQEITITLTAQDLAKLARDLKNSGGLARIAGELKRVVISVAVQEANEEKKKDQAALKKLQAVGSGSSLDMAEPDPQAEPATANHDVAGKLRQALKPLLFERSIARRKPSFTGSRFAPSRFHEIKTRPDGPRLRKEVLRTGRAPVETEIILCFDRSGSMSGEKEAVAKEVAATFHEALKTVTQARLAILGFDTEVNLIKGSGKGFGCEVLARIGSGLTARGGTDFPLALHEALRQAGKSTARKKLVVMLTDGDINGQIDLDDLLRFARQSKTEIITIGVQGSDKDILQQELGKTQVVYVEDIHALPEEMRRLAIRKA